MVDTVYSQGAFELSLEFPESYPMSPPVVKFVSKASVLQDLFLAAYFIDT